MLVRRAGACSGKEGTETSRMATARSVSRGRSGQYVGCALETGNRDAEAEDVRQGSFDRVRD